MKKLLLTIFLSFIFIHLMYASDGPNVWSTSLSNAGPIWSVVVNPVNQNILYAGSNTTGVWESIDNGVNWAPSNIGLNNLTIQTLAISRSNPNILYCGTSQVGAGAGIYKSEDAGITFTQINNGIQETSLGIQSIAIDPTNPDIAYVAVFDGLVDSQQGVYKTTDGGSTWNVANTGIGIVKNILSIIINPFNPNALYCGTSFAVVSAMGPSHIYKSVDGAASWTDISNGLPNLSTDTKPVRCLSMSTSDTSVVLAGLFLNTDSLSGMYLTTNGGEQWVRRHNGVPNAVGTLPRSCLIRQGSTKEFYVGLGDANTNAGFGAFRTTDGGITWTDFNGGTLANTTPIRSLNFKTTDSTIYAGGAHPTLATGQGVFEYTWLITGIGNQNGSVPKEFLLKQNYPNPFNPRTIINYELPIPDYVAIKVYDMNGREVKTLVNERQSAGSYTLNFDGSGLSSGVYYYKLSAGSYTNTKKMILIK